MIPKRVRAIVEARSGGVCEGCRAAPASEMHHRKFRSRGGRDEVVNILHLCGWGNHSGCHGVAHSGARGADLGWALPSGSNPERQPANAAFYDLTGHAWWLLPDGGVEEAFTDPGF